MKDNWGKKCVNGGFWGKNGTITSDFLENESFSSFDPTSPPVPP